MDPSSAPGLSEREISDLYEKYYEGLVRYAFSLIADFHDAEEVVQASYLKAFISRSKLRDSEKAKAWLLRIVRNVAFSLGRDRKRRGKTEDYGTTFPERTDYRRVATEEEVERVANMLRVRQFIRRTDLITEGGRNVLMLGFAGLTNAKIAVEMNTKEKTVRSMKSQAIAKLLSAAEDGMLPWKTFSEE